MTRRRPLALIAFAALAAWADAQPAPRGPTVAEQAALLKRNRGLLQALVDCGLDLSAKPEPLNRLAACTRAADKLAREIGEAAEHGEAARLAELGGHLDAILKEGVEPNVRTARQNIAVGSGAERELFRRRDEALAVLKRVEASLRAAGAAVPGRTTADLLESLNVGRIRVQRAGEKR